MAGGVTVRMASAWILLRARETVLKRFFSGMLRESPASLRGASAISTRATRSKSGELLVALDHQAFPIPPQPHWIKRSFSITRQDSRVQGGGANGVFSLWLSIGVR